VAQEGITRKEHHNNLILGVDLDFAETQIGRRVLYLGIPIFKSLPYAPPPGPTDKYEGLRKWYRKNIEGPGGMFIVHRRDLQHSLNNAQPDAVDYLVVEDEVERDKHPGWLEPSNEAIEIEHWILPAAAVDKAVVATDFIFENIKVIISKSDIPIDEVNYFVTPMERTLYYSGHGKPKK
jgi:hypothetical protein